MSINKFENLSSFLNSCLQWYPIIPAAVLCLAPMHGNLKYSLKQTLSTISAFLLIMLIFLSFTRVDVENIIHFPLIFFLVLSFLLYHHHVNVHISKSLCIFLVVFALIGFPYNISVGFDATIHPFSDIAHFSLEASIFRVLNTTLFAALLFKPFKKYGGFLVDNFHLDHVWYLTLPVSSIFIFYNTFITIRKYDTLHVNKVPFFYWVSIILLLSLLIFLCAIYYFIVRGIINAAKEQERNRILEMQESQYTKQRNYIEATARQRHDFRQTLRMLCSLVDEGNLEAVSTYLKGYVNTLPKNEVANICKNTAVNALFNFYINLAVERVIDLDLDIDLPETTKLSDMDLCNIIGNILDNAVIACQDLPEGERFIDFSIRNDDFAALYIVVTNSFNGKVRKRNGTYLSTHRHEAGNGLRSVSFTVEKYGGIANFSHENKQFMSNIMLPI